MFENTVKAKMCVRASTFNNSKFVKKERSGLRKCSRKVIKILKGII